jgi:hypothetical protein
MDKKEIERLQVCAKKLGCFKNKLKCFIRNITTLIKYEAIQKVETLAWTRKRLKDYMFE